MQYESTLQCYCSYFKQFWFLLFYPPQLGTFRSSEGEFFVEPLHSYNGEHYEEEHTKPHIVYRKKAPKKEAAREDTACDTSGTMKWWEERCNGDFCSDAFFCCFFCERESVRARAERERAESVSLRKPVYQLTESAFTWCLMALSGEEKREDGTPCWELLNV